MRRVLALALTALVLSGCSTATTDDPSPPNADPNGQQTLPPLSSGPSTGPPTASNSTSTQATSASTSTAPRSASFGPHDAEDSATDPDFPSLLVGGRLQGSGPQVRIEATANNMGERDYKVKGGCEDPWSESLRRAGGSAVQHRQPVAACAGYTMVTFAAHEFLATALTWNGTLWDAASASFVTAPAGTYVWTVTFDVYSGGSGTSFEEHAAMTMTFDVEVA